VATTGPPPVMEVFLMTYTFVLLKSLVAALNMLPPT
jgi:hypothetical protein